MMNLSLRLAFPLAFCKRKKGSQTLGIRVALFPAPQPRSESQTCVSELVSVRVTGGKAIRACARDSYACVAARADSAMRRNGGWSSVTAFHRSCKLTQKYS